MNYLNKYFLDVFKKCFTIQGREGRKVFWLFELNVLVFTFLCSYIFNILSAALPQILSYVLLIPVIIYMILLFCTQITLTIRRLHDINLIGWWYLIGFVPFIGGIILIVMCIWPGTDGENKYGMPK